LKLPDVQRIQAAKQAIKIRKLLQDKKAGKSYGSGMINNPSANMNINTVEYFPQYENSPRLYFHYISNGKFLWPNVAVPIWPEMAGGLLSAHHTYHSISMESE
jgi:hypothetical protein